MQVKLWIILEKIWMLSKTIHQDYPVQRSVSRATQKGVLTQIFPIENDIVHGFVMISTLYSIFLNRNRDPNESYSEAGREFLAWLTQKRFR